MERIWKAGVPAALQHPTSDQQSCSRASQGYLPHVEQSSWQRLQQQETRTVQRWEDFSLWVSSHVCYSSPRRGGIQPFGWMQGLDRGCFHVSSSLSHEKPWEFPLQCFILLIPASYFFSITTLAAVSLYPTCLQLFHSKQMSFTFFFSSEHLKKLHFNWINLRSYKHQTLAVW